MSTMTELQLRYAIAHLAIVAFKCKDDRPREDLIILLEWHLKDLEQKNLVYGFRVIFDETIWLPSEPESYRNIIQIIVGRPGLKWAVLFDLNKTHRDGVFLLGYGFKKQVDFFTWEEE